MMASFSPHITFPRAEWASFREDVPLTLDADDIARLQGLNENVLLEEVADVYLPLARLLSLYIDASQQLHRASATFLGDPAAKVPFVIGMAGSVAVGKSTTARILRALLARWPQHPRVDLITTDGFLLPNETLEARGIMHRKGFPESYDVHQLIDFVAAVKAGEPDVQAPVYSHLTYNVQPDATIQVSRPDVLILEGINVLQTPRIEPGKPATVYVSDFFDFSIYVDADPRLIKTWFLERFHALRNTAFQDPSSYFHRYTSISREEADAYAHSIWRDINEVNLFENILPTRERADLVLRKGAGHAVEEVKLRKL